MTRADLRQRIAQARDARAQHDRVRQRRTVLRRDGMRCEVADAHGRTRWLHDFCGNDYLGLSRDPAVLNAAQVALARDGAGSTASHLVCGHGALHDALEREVADWLQAPRALLFGSGYLANLGVLQALAGDGDTCVQDKLNHASLIDGARLSGARLHRYPHGDAAAALRQLQSAKPGAALLATDGVFSMDGDVAPLRELAFAAHAQGALLYVDDAHGVGVHGPEGRGSSAAAGLSVRDVPLQLATLGKALGGYGAVVAGEAALIEHLLQAARPYIYTTALPPAQAAASLAAVRIARSDTARRGRLHANIAHFRDAARRAGIALLPSDTPIQPVPCSSETVALAKARALEDAGFWVGAIRPPTVPEGGSRLRITLSAQHAIADIDALIDALARASETALRPPRTDAGA
jgi:8-amino-7-oxononanoate synthase